MSPFVERLVSQLKLTDNTRPPEDGRRRAAVSILLHDEVAEPRVLLMKRTERQGDPWSGHVSLPGGGYQSSDADLLTTAIRETREELGIDLGHARLLGNLMPLHPFTSGPQGVEVTPFVFVTNAAVEPVAGPEAQYAFWLSMDLASSGKIDGNYTYPGTERTFPAWLYDQHTIWGLTWRILSDLISVSKR